MRGLTTTQVNSLAIRSPAAQQQPDEFERAARQAAPAPTRVNSPAFAAIGVQPEQDPAGRETAERNAEDAEAIKEDFEELHGENICFC